MLTQSLLNCIDHNFYGEYGFTDARFSTYILFSLVGNADLIAFLDNTTTLYSGVSQFHELFGKHDFYFFGHDVSFWTGKGTIVIIIYSL